MLPQRSYTARQAAIAAAIVWVAALAWIVWTWHAALPFHPWISVPAAVSIFVTGYLFAVLDAKGKRAVNRLIGVWYVTLLVAVASAAGFGAAGGPFPWWAAAPCVAVLFILAVALLWFGAINLYRCARYKWITRNLYTTLPPQEFDRLVDR